MKIPTFYEVEKILNTLPIGYYIGRNVLTKLTVENCTYYKMMEDKIFISYPTISGILNKNIDKCTNENIERLIRTLLYHEVSHAFLTPQELKVNDIINVFEDERIEQICKSFYLNVDFEELVKLVNDWDGESIPECKTPAEVWYTLIRYHIGKKEYLDEVKNIILKFRNLNRISCYEDVVEYRNEILFLYEKIKIKFEVENLMLKKDIEDSDSFNKIINDVNFNDFIKSEFKGLNVKKIFENTTYYDEKYKNKLNDIIVNSKKLNMSNANAINAHSGIFDAKSVIRNDYKWFVQQNRQGHIKQFSKIKLNLFIDVSGSFMPNQYRTNKILFALSNIEKQNPHFSFDVITMQFKFKVLPKTQREIFCDGGNDIPIEARNIISSVADKQANNYNIVLFDGDALTDSVDESGKQFEYFNVLNNCVMILDESNKKYAEKYCKKHKIIYSKNYINELFDAICNALQILFK